MIKYHRGHQSEVFSARFFRVFFYVTFADYYDSSGMDIVVVVVSCQVESTWMGVGNSFGFVMRGLCAHAVIVQGVKDKKKLLASDLYQSLKICIHGQFHILD